MAPTEGSSLPINNRILSDPILLQRPLYSYFTGIRDSFIEQSDVVLLVDDYRFPAHSQLLGAHSPVFSDMFSACTTFSRDSRQLRLHDTFEQVSALLCYLYGSVSAGKRHIKSRDEAAALAAIAHKYNVQKASRAAEKFLLQQIPSMTLNDAIDWAVLADAFDLPLLLTKVQLFLMEHFCDLNEEQLGMLTESLSSRSIMNLARGFAYAWEASAVVCHCGYKTQRSLCNEPHIRLGFTYTCTPKWKALAPLPDSARMLEWLEVQEDV
eukprot:jgi/Botrbrau1/19438/Bobra.0338s0060.1